MDRPIIYSLVGRPPWGLNPELGKTSKSTCSTKPNASMDSGIHVEKSLPTPRKAWRTGAVGSPLSNLAPSGVRLLGRPPITPASALVCLLSSVSMHRRMSASVRLRRFRWDRMAKGNPGQRSSRGPFAGRESARRQDGHCLFDWFLGNHGAPMVGLRKPIKYAGNGNPWRRSTRGTLAGRLDDRRQDEILPTRDNLMGECWRASHSSLAPARVFVRSHRVQEATGPLVFDDDGSNRTGGLPHVLEANHPIPEATAGHQFIQLTRR